MSLIFVHYSREFVITVMIVITEFECIRLKPILRQLCQYLNLK